MARFNVYLLLALAAIGTFARPHVGTETHISTRDSTNQSTEFSPSEVSDLTRTEDPIRIDIPNTLITLWIFSDTERTIAKDVVNRLFSSVELRISVATALHGLYSVLRGEDMPFRVNEQALLKFLVRAAPGMFLTWENMAALMTGLGIFSHGQSERIPTFAFNIVDAGMLLGYGQMAEWLTGLSCGANNCNEPTSRRDLQAVDSQQDLKLANSTDLGFGPIIPVPVPETYTVVFVKLSGIRIDRVVLRSLLVRTSATIQDKIAGFGPDGRVNDDFTVNIIQRYYFRAESDRGKLLTWKQLRNAANGLKQLLLYEGHSEEADFIIQEKTVRQGSGTILKV